MVTMDGNRQQSGSVGPRANGLQLPEILRSGRLPEIDAALWAEYRPQTITEELLVQEIARRAIAMENSSSAATAWREFAAKSLGDFVISGVVAAVGPYDGPLAEGVPCDAADRSQRRSIAHSQAFFRALHRLLMLKSCRTANVRPIADIPFTGFEREQRCVEYLAAWRRSNFTCRACGNRAAHFIPSRLCLECSKCKTQCGLRSGTLMADSALPLSTWFLAIWSVLREPNVKVGELQLRLGLQRVATVRAMLGKIRQALAAEQRSEPLAGLDQYDAEPESSVRLQIDHKAIESLSLASVRNSQPVNGETFAHTAAPTEIE